MDSLEYSTGEVNMSIVNIAMDAITIQRIFVGYFLSISVKSSFSEN